ncbi:hypothetical protein J6590_043259 [Homalodisca vitripennis]|nr:hypothetical protein J6590_043259 [Homalodisca vitripennis]
MSVQEINATNQSDVSEPCRIDFCYKKPCDDIASTPNEQRKYIVYSNSLYLKLNLHQQQNHSRETAERAANHALLPFKLQISVRTPKVDN